MLYCNEVTWNMFLRLVFRNVKRNLKTYSVYFITLSLIYCMLYGFNGISGHPVMQNMSTYKEIMARIMQQYMGVLSFVVMIAVAFLVVYATNFVLHRRKKELGLYASLGMKNRDIARIIFMETLLVNFVSLLIGVILGMGFLRILARFAIVIYESQYQGSLWHWDRKAFYFLVIVFVVSNLLICVLNIRNFAKKNIISFLNEENRSVSGYKKNNNVRYIFELFAGTIIFTGCLKFIFDFMYNSGSLSELMDYGYVIAALILASIIMIYDGLGNGFCSIVTRCKGIYFRKLNSFAIRQIMGNLNQNSIAMSIIALSVALSFAIIFIGGSAYETIHRELQYASPYNVMIFHHLDNERNSLGDDISIIKLLKDDGLDITSYSADETEFYVYNSGLVYGALFGYTNYWQTDSSLAESEVQVISLSDYNKVMRIEGNKEIELNDEQFAINCNYKGTLEKVNDFADTNPQINIGRNQTLSFSQITSETIIMTSAGNNDRGTLIVPDCYVSTLRKYLRVFVGKYDNEDNATSITDFLGMWVEKYTYTDDNGIQYEIEFQTKDRLSTIYLGFMGTIIFIMGFIGVIFIIISLSILSIQMLATSMDMTKDYNVLRTLGIEQRRESRTLFSQIAWYFFMPFIVAIPAGVVGGMLIINYISNFINLTIKLNFQYLIWIFIFFVIYLGITYISCRRIVCIKE